MVLGAKHDSIYLLNVCVNMLLKYDDGVSCIAR